MSGHRALATLIFVTALSFACSSDPLREALDHVGRGDQYVTQKKYPEAILEYKIAISLVDISSLAHFKLAEAYAKTDELPKALAEYVRAADLAPENDDFQVKAGNLLLAAGRYQDAKNRARIVLERNQKSVPAILLLANALVGLKDFSSAAELGKRAVDLDPERAGAYRNLGVTELLRGNADSAELAFRRALELDPTSIRAYLSLGNLYRAAGARSKAEEAYKRALQLDPNGVAANQALASLYIDWKRAEEAEPFLKVAAARSEVPDATLSLGDYYIGMSRLDDAKRVLQPLAAGDSDARIPAITRLAVIEYAAAHREAAQQLLDTAIAANPKAPIPLATKARLLLSDNKVDEALAAANAAVNADPRSPEAHLALGRVHLARQERDDARKAFNEALAYGPSSIEAQLELAKLHLQRGELETAIQFAQQGIEAQPDSLDAQLLLVRTMAARSDDDGRAEKALTPLLARYPRAPQVHNMVGVLAFQRGDVAGARKAWERALELDSTNVDAIGGIAAMLSPRKPADAWKFVDSRLKLAPNNPGLLLLAAKVRIVNRDQQGAETLLKKSLEVDPSNLDAYALLGRIYVSQKRTDDARREFSAMLRQQPKSVAIHTMMGLLAEQQRDVDSAIGWYKKALQINPRAAVAANNLAWIYVSRDTELDSAMRLAEIARGEMPKQAQFSDTLGWVYYKKQLTAQAIETLERAVQLDPKNPTNHYHLGMAYVQDGTDPKARQALQQALNINPNFPQAEDARQALSKLVY